MSAFHIFQGWSALADVRILKCLPFSGLDFTLSVPRRRKALPETEFLCLFGRLAAQVTFSANPLLELPGQLVHPTGIKNFIRVETSIPGHAGPSLHSSAGLCLSWRYARHYWLGRFASISNSHVDSIMRLFWLPQLAEWRRTRL